jgi:penicillin-binding protein 1A
VLFLALAASVAWYVADLTRDLPNYDALAQYAPPGTTRVHAGNGQLIAEYAYERRLYLPIQAIPEGIKNAFISAEDKNFYQHTGLDYFGIIRALAENVERLGTGGNLVGASTITQQVARNILLTRDQTWERKVTEGVLALRMEQIYSKDKILELYLNEIPFGLGSYGIAAASLTYFNKAVHELTLPEVAFLAALPKAPANYDPYRHPDRAVERRNWVIDRMVENGYLAADEAEIARRAPLEVKVRNTSPTVFAADYFAEEVRRQLATMYGEKTLYEGGLSVRTSLDTNLQVMARKALMNGLVNFDMARGWRGPVARLDSLAPDWGVKLAEVPPLRDVVEWRLAVVLSINATAANIGLQPAKLPGLNAVDSRRETGTIAANDMKLAGKRLKAGDVIYVEAVDAAAGKYRLRQVPEIEGGMVVMDPHTGRVLALVGGFSFSQSQFNRATQAQRQPGSAFKPFVYAAALDNGYQPTSIVMDGPITLSQGPGLPPWTPENYGDDFLGPSTLRTGVEQSRNVMTVRLAQDMGMPMIAEYTRRFGVVDNLPHHLSMALGAGETTVLKMVAGYAVFPNGGQEVRPTLIDRVQDRYGNTIFRGDKRSCPECAAESWKKQGEPTIEDNARQVVDPTTAYQMVSIMEGVVQRGTGTAAKVIGKPVAGKTGTTSDNKDVWFIGYTPNLVVGLYLGYDQPRTIGSRATGGGLAVPIFTDFMQAALTGKPAVPFRVPPGIVFQPIDRVSGTRVPQGGPGTVMEAFKAGTVLPPADRPLVVGTAPIAPIAPIPLPPAASGPGGIFRR